GQAAHPGDDNGIAFLPNAGAHALQFGHVQEAVFEHGFGNRTDTLGDTVERAELRLHVGGKARVWRRTQTHGTRPRVAHVDFDPDIAAGDAGAARLQLGDDGLDRLRPR